MIVSARKLIGKGQWRIFSCPISLAVKAAIGGNKPKPDYVSTTGSVIQIGRLKYEAPEAAKVFISRFDKKLPVEPISFELDLSKGEY